MPIYAEIAAQPAGSPVFSQSHREFTFSFNGGYLRKNIYGVHNDSPRLLVKSLFGLAKFVDVFGEIGFVKLNLTTSGESQFTFKDKYHLAFGGGITLRYLNFKRIRFSLFVSGRIFRFTSNPSSEKIANISSSEIEQSLEMRYDWREVTFNSGFIKGLGFANIFSGIQGKLIQRHETKISKFIIAGGVDSENQTFGEYKSGLQISPFWGIDILLPSRFTISLELIAISKTDFNINVGISQTGKP